MMPKIKVEIEVPSDKYCDTIDNVCPMLQEGNWGKTKMLTQIY